MEKIIRPVFNLEVSYQIVPGLVTIGKYDGTHPCMTAATVTDKVLIHSPHRKTSTVQGRILVSETNRELATLNINQNITCLAVGMILPDDEKDVLFIGTSTHVLAYHVHDNKDIFYKESPDGVKSLTVGHFQGNSNPVVMVGGNSSVHGYDHLGNEIFWTAVGDIVTSMILMDYNKDGSNELLVSSEDYNIRIFQGNQLIGELLETEIVTNLAVLPDNRFAYSVSNGTVGVYEKDVRLWRIKSKHSVVSIHYYDLLGQSSPQLIIGWSNGSINCRSIKTGDVLFKDELNSGVAGIIEGDYRSIGKTDLICVSSEGEVRGYTTTKTSFGDNTTSYNDVVKDLLTQKQALLMELKNYEYNSKYNENLLNETESFENVGAIPANTKVQIALSSVEKPEKILNVQNFKPHVELYITTNNATIIRAVLIFAEGIFKGESHVVHPPATKLKSDLTIPLFPPRNSQVDLHIKVLVGYPSSIQYHVFEITQKLPRFSMFALRKNNELTVPNSHVEFKINERLPRFCIWINQNFLFPTEIVHEGGPKLTLNLKCLRDDTNLVMTFETTGKITFSTLNMQLAADLVHSLSSFLNISQLESKANFPEEEENLKHLLEKIAEIQDASVRLDADVADKMSQIRTLIVKAEDYRLFDLKEMSNSYNELNAINQELIGGHNIRRKNHEEGIDAMKQVNAIIQRASRLRVGQNAANIIGHCRTCIKDNNVDGLISIIRNGKL